MYGKAFFPKFNSAVLFQKRRAVESAQEADFNDQDDGFFPMDSPSPQKLLLSRNEPDSQMGAPPSAAAAVSGSLFIFVAVAGAFMLLGLLATTFLYVRRKRSSSFGLLASNHKVMLLKKKAGDIIPGQLDKGFFISSYSTGPTKAGTPPSGAGAQGGKTRAVRSPSSGQVNPFQKKTPSPTTGKESVLGGNVIAEECANNNGKQAITSEINNNNEETVHRHNAKAKRMNSTDSFHESGATLKEALTESALPQNTSALKKGSIDSTTGAATATNLGQLHFKLKYNYEKRALTLVIIRCSDLPPVKEGSNGSMDPYVKMQLLPEKQHKAKTRVLRKTTNPLYNEEFTFFGIAPKFENLVVHFVVLNFDRFSRDEILGEVIVSLNQFEFDSLEKQISLVRDIAPRGNKLKIQDLGELLISLCYQPIANRLTVVILKGRDLPKMDLTGLCDPYVKIYVYHKGSRLFKKRTHVKKRTLSPVFNESFVFDIPHEEGLDNIQMQFLVYDHDRVTRNELIGKIDMSCQTGGSVTEKHWNEVIKSPRKQIAQWHKLVEC